MAISETKLRAQVVAACKRAGLTKRPTVAMWTAAEERKAKARDHAYVYPADLAFHFSKKTLSLDKAHRDAIVSHEVGHCLAQHHWGSSTEDEADDAAMQWLGTPICYDHAWPGKGLQVECSRTATGRQPNPRQARIARRISR